VTGHNLISIAFGCGFCSIRLYVCGLHLDEFHLGLLLLGGGDVELFDLVDHGESNEDEACNGHG